MSGHSKWSQIKHKKALTDAKKGKVFSKLARIITLAARDKGSDPKTNPNLRIAIEKAKAANMPNDNIERAIKKGSGEIGGAKMESFTYEAYAPGGVALIIEGITDNKNRTVSEVKHILSTGNGKFAESGSVSYLFDKKGVITINNTEKQLSQDELELIAIEAGAEDLKWQNDVMEVYIKPESLEEAKKTLEKKSLPIRSSSLEWVAKTEIETEDEKVKEQLNKLLEALDEHDDINEIYSNLKA